MDPTHIATTRSVSAPVSGKPGLIFPHQLTAFRQLLATARAFSSENWFALTVLPRWHCLLIGATGTGKSHLIRVLAKFLRWPIYSTFVTRWIIAGGRGRETWAEIAQWLACQEGKCIIFLDEIDKIHHSEIWSTHLRTEIYQLLDRDLPNELEIDDSDSQFSKDTLWARAKLNLQCNCFIVSAGAFQGIWAHRPRGLGFNAATAATEPSPTELKEVIPPELINRFARILILPSLVETDYRMMIAKTGPSLPSEIREKFYLIAEKHLQKAITEGKGTRYLGECVTEALLSDSHTNHTPPPKKVTSLKSLPTTRP